MLNRFIEHIKSNNLFSEGESLVIAVSGGVDSMVLSSLLGSLGLVYSVAHVNHNTRAGASDRDRDFVNDYFNERGIKVHNLSYQHDGEGNFHDLAHKARYTYFHGLGYDKILTAHHMDDHIETILVNFFNGRSVDGILEQNGDVIRPLLAFTKAEILSYADENAVPFVTDVSNRDSTYLRNFIRKDLLPLIDTRGDIVPKIKNLSRRATADATLLNGLIREQISIVKKNGVERINLVQLTNKSATYLYHALSTYGINRFQATDLEGMLGSVGKKLLTATHQIIVDRADILIKQLSTTSQEAVVVQLRGLPFTIPYGPYTLSFSISSELPTSIPVSHGYFPRQLLGKELVIRKWRDGDFMYPFGMNGKSKKLKSLFNDMKVDRMTKSDLPVILNNEEIIWVASLRTDERYKVSAADNDLLKIELSS